MTPPSPGRLGPAGPGRHVLLVSPSFHGYWRSIAGALEARGHQVTSHTYDLNPTWRHRIGHQAMHELPRRVGLGDLRRLAATQTRSSLAALREARPDVVVVVKGDLLGEEFWAELDHLRLPRVLWLYDEVRRTRWTRETLAGVGPIASYSALDVADFQAADLPAHYLPLAFDQHLVGLDSRERTDEIVFVGACYPGRREALERLDRAGVPVRAFGRDWSHHPVDRLRTWGAARPAVPSGRDLSRSDTYRTMAAAAGALNIHGDQDGFTMRTFEAAGTGGVELIDRADVASLYDPGSEVLVYRSLDELVELARRARTDRTWTEAIRVAGRRRTLAEHTFDHRVAVLEDLWAR